MKRNWIRYAGFLILSLVFVIALGVNAQTTVDQNTPTVTVGTLDNPFKGGGSRIDELLTALINQVLLPIGSVVAVIAFIWTGFLFVSAQGNESKLETAKRALLYTVIGTAILLGATVIANVVTNTINALR